MSQPKPTARHVLAVLAALIMITSVVAPATAVHSSPATPGDLDAGVEASETGDATPNGTSKKASVVSQRVDELASEAESGETDSELVTQSGGETRITVAIEAAPGKSGAVADLATEHGSVVARFGGAVEASLPPGAIDAIADSPAVDVIRVPSPAITTDQGSVVSDGLSNMNVSSVHGDGYTGSGITVAVVDSGFNVANSEIQDHVAGFRNFENDGDADDVMDNTSGLHGTAVAELVVDTAPNVSLLLYEVGTGIEMGAAIEHVTRNTSADVATMSLGFTSGPFDGTSEVDDAIETSVANGVTWFVASGNYADAQHYNQTWSDGDGDGWMDVDSGGESIQVDATGKFDVTVSWADEDHDVSSEDYDVFLNDSGSPVDSSTDPQPPHRAVESVGADTGGTYTLRIKNYDANGTADFDVFVSGDATITPNTSSRSVSRPATEETALAVGAVYYDTNGLEGFSSRGPTVDGRLKPELVAPDGVQTSQPGGSGLNPFSGTSAATPHAAGVAALVLDAVNDSIGPGDVRSSLTSSATPLETPIPNNRTGFGLANATGAVGIAQDIAGSLRVSGGSITPDAANASETVTHDVNLTVRNVEAGGDSVTFYVVFPDSFGLSPNSVSVVDGEGNSVSISSSKTVVDGPDPDGNVDTIRFGVQPDRGGSLVDLTGSVNVDVTHPSVFATTEFSIYGAVNDTNANAHTGPEEIAQVTVQNGTESTDIVQTGGYTRSDGFNTSGQVGIIANRNLTLDGGANYQFRVTDEDSGASVTLAPNGSLAVPAGEFIGLGLYDARGNPADSPIIFSVGTIGLNVVNGSIPAAPGLTNFSVALLDATGSELSRTGTRPVVVGYSGTLGQNGTTGQVRLSIPGDVIPRSSTVNLSIVHRDGIDGRFATMQYNATTDEFFTTVNASGMAAGNYSWGVAVGFEGVRALQFGSGFMDNRNITLRGGTTGGDDGNLSIVQYHSWTYSNGTGTSKAVGIAASEDLAFDGGNNYRIRLRNADSGESVTLTLGGSGTLPAGEPMALYTYDEEGTIFSSPFTLSRTLGSLPLNVASGPIPAAPGLTNFSVALLDASDGSLLAETATHPAVVGYTGLLSQNSTTGTVEFSVPRDVVPAGASVQLRLAPRDGGDPTVLPMSYDSDDTAFETTVQADDFGQGNYSWNAYFEYGGVQVLSIAGDRPNSTKRNVTIGSTDDADDSVTVTGSITDANGNPAANDTIISGSITETADDGSFAVSVPSGVDAGIAYFQTPQEWFVDVEGTPEPGSAYPNDGSPDVYALDAVNVSSETDLGGYDLPTAHRVNVTVLDESDHPVENATVVVTHTNDTTGASAYASMWDATNPDGMLQPLYSADVGVELVGNVTIEVEPPEGGSFVDRTYTRNLSVDAPTEVTINLKESGVEVTGRVLNASGDPVENDTVVAFTREVSDVVVPQLSGAGAARTNESGYFTLRVPANDTYDLAYYQGDPGDETDRFPRDGSPDVYGLTQVTVADSDVMLERAFQLEPGYDLNVSVVDESDNPVEGARVAYFHAAGASYESSGVSGAEARTNADGLADLSANASRPVPGLEVAGNVTVFAAPPEDEGFVDRIYQRNRTVAMDDTVQITLNTTCIAGAVAGSDGTIGLSEIQTAIDWWARNTEVPETGGETISLSEIQSLIDAWARGNTVSCSG